jgi:hypothetical protein
MKIKRFIAFKKTFSLLMISGGSPKDLELTDEFDLHMVAIKQLTI